MNKKDEGREEHQKKAGVRFERRKEIREALKNYGVKPSDTTINIIDRYSYANPKLGFDEIIKENIDSIMQLSKEDPT